jgi:hypothetical protein
MDFSLSKTRVNYKALDFIREEERSFPILGEVPIEEQTPIPHFAWPYEPVLVHILWLDSRVRVRVLQK